MTAFCVSVSYLVWFIPFGMGRPRAGTNSREEMVREVKQQPVEVPSSDPSLVGNVQHGLLGPNVVSRRYAEERIHLL